MTTPNYMLLSRKQTAECYGVSPDTVTNCKSYIKVITPLGIARWQVPTADMLASTSATIRNLAKACLLEHQTEELKKEVANVTAG